MQIPVRNRDSLEQEVSHDYLSLPSRKEKHFQIYFAEWLGLVSSGLITGPTAYIFAGVLITTIYSSLDLTKDYKEDSTEYKQLRPLYVIQLSVAFSIIFLCPVNYLISKLTIKNEHDHHGEHEESIKEKIQKLTFGDKKDKTVWKVDPKDPNTFEFANEYVFKPSLIRSYQKRSKTLNILRYAFEKSTALWDAHSPHAEHGHGDDHGHGDSHGQDHHGHSDSKGHHNHKDHLDIAGHIEGEMATELSPTTSETHSH